MFNFGAQDLMLNRSDNKHGLCRQQDKLLCAAPWSLFKKKLPIQSLTCRLKILFSTCMCLSLNNLITNYIFRYCQKIKNFVWPS